MLFYANLKRTIPFSISRNDSRSLIDQAADGLRAAIGSGFFKVGVPLPSYDELASELGVSRNVMRAAVGKLRDENLVRSRPRIGSVVLGRHEPVWNGRVLLLLSDRAVGYYKSMFLCELQDQLAKAGYYTQTFRATEGLPGKYDLKPLERILDQSFDLTFMFYGRETFERFFSRRRLPYVAYSLETHPRRGRVGRVFQSNDSALGEFVRHCIVSGVKHVTHVKCWGDAPDLRSAFKSTGITVTDWEIDLSNGRQHSAEGVQRSAMEQFLNFLANGKPALPDVFFFSDDYLTAGAMTALQHMGVQSPEDVRIVTLSNSGLGPVYLRAFTRFEVDPVRHGRITADALIAYLKTGTFPSAISLDATYIHGETF